MSDDVTYVVDRVDNCSTETVGERDDREEAISAARELAEENAPPGETVTDRGGEHRPAVTEYQSGGTLFMVFKNVTPSDTSDEVNSSE